MNKLIELKECPTQVGTEFVVCGVDGGRYYSSICKVTKEGVFVWSDSYNGYAHPYGLIESDAQFFALPHAELRALYKEKGSNFEDWEVLPEGYIASLAVRCKKEPLWMPHYNYYYKPLPKEAEKVPHWLWIIKHGATGTAEIGDEFFRTKERADACWSGSMYTVVGKAEWSKVML